MKQKKISYVSLGCAKNQVDFEYLIGELSNDGFIAETDPAKCDAVIINTCGFIEPAVKEAIDNILQMENLISKKAKLIVTGCMVERYKDDILKEMPEIDFITGVGKLSEAADYLRKEFNIEKHEGKNLRAITNAPYYAYVKISEGCNNTCAFCVIPNIRGRLKSRTMEDIEQEIEMLQAQGVQEIIIISQDTTQYGMDIYGEEKLIPLMKKLTSKFNNLLFRMLYLNPEGVSEEVIKFVAETKNVIKYFEVPVQHASDNILTKMRRASTRQVIDNVFDTIRKLCPEAFIRTTFIVGFTGESEEDFNELYKFINGLSCRRNTALHICIFCVVVVAHMVVDARAHPCAANDDRVFRKQIYIRAVHRDRQLIRLIGHIGAQIFRAVKCAQLLPGNVGAKYIHALAHAFNCVL